MNLITIVARFPGAVIRYRAARAPHAARKAAELRALRHCIDVALITR